MAAVAVSASPIAFLTHAEAKPVYVGVEGENIGVGGYDVVSYFMGDGVPVKGNATIMVKHEGVAYHFSSQKNADAFSADPAQFLPQYGGHCAWAMARGSIAPGDPTVYKIVDGKLYLNFNKQVQNMWLKDISGFIEKANAEWKEIPDDAAFGA
ncbi:hypothetical protein LPB140_09095 [Sphingorhabdus lutea]|uniref:YHS domain-containing protein n=1 Tax=Sphingorhabdus lutea TaxID=1913578 RepID=A0A1L3JF21_9SPHN|nr:hypothetical protein LPB140_09095 [Sphingorhabdus lutea]